MPSPQIRKETPMKLDERALDAAARLHPHWMGEGSMGALSARRNAEEIVRAYLRAVEGTDSASAGTGTVGSIKLGSNCDATRTGIVPTDDLPEGG